MMKEIMMNNNDDEIRHRNKDLHQHAALHWNSLANHHEFDLIKQLLYTSTILLTTTASLVILDRSIITPEIRIILLFTWLFFVISIITGVIQIILNIKYFAYLLRDESMRAEIWSKRGETSDLFKKEESLEKTKMSSGNIPLILQGVFASLGLLSILTIGIIVLFR